MFRSKFTLNTHAHAHSTSLYVQLLDGSRRRCNVMDLIGVSAAFYRPSKTLSKPSSRTSLPVAGLHLNWRSTHRPKSQVQNTNSGKSTYICMTFECSKITFSETARPPVSAASDPGAVCSNGTFFSTLLQIFSTNSNIKATNQDMGRSTMEMMPTTCALKLHLIAACPFHAIHEMTLRSTTLKP